MYNTFSDPDHYGTCQYCDAPRWKAHASWCTSPAAATAGK